MMAACGQQSHRTAPVVHDVGVFDYLGPDFWHTRAKAQAIIREGSQRESQGDFAFAIGKYQQAYRLSPQETQLPLLIARNYARIAGSNPAASYEKQKSLEWLYRAFLVDNQFGEAVFHEADFQVLENEDVFKALKKNFGLSSDREILSVLKRLTAMARETQVVVGEIGSVLRGISGILEWVGFPFLCLMFLTLFFQWGFFQFGFPRGLFTTTLGFLLGTGVWVYGNRILSGGGRTGAGAVFEILFTGGMVLLVIFFCRLGFRWLRQRILRAWKRSRLYHRYFFRPLCQAPLSFKDQLFRLDNLHHQLRLLGHRYVLSDDTEETQDILRQLEALRSQIHQVTEKPWET